MLLVNGCSYTYGDELKRPDKQRWSNYLQYDAHNIARCGASNPKIFRTTMDALMYDDGKYDGVIIMWSAFERMEFINMSAHNLDWSGNPDHNPWVDASPARLDSRKYPPVTKKVEALQHYYNELYTNEGGIWMLACYMTWIYELCKMKGIDCMQGWFHQAMLSRYRRQFSGNNDRFLGGRLPFIERPVASKMNSLPDWCLIGCPGTDYRSFNAFTEEGGYRKMPEQHPGPEAHKAYADYLNSIIDEHRLFEEKK